MLPSIVPGGGPDTLFVGHPRPATTRDILEAVRAALACGAAIVPIPTAVTGMAAPLCDLLGRIVGRPLALTRYAELMAGGFVCRVDRLRERLGVVAEIDLRDGLAATAASYRREKWI